MPIQKRNLELANMVVKFGDDLVLMDLFDELVKPAFFDKTLRRTYDETEYLLHKVQLIDLGDGIAGIGGRIIKDTLLHVDQILVDGKLENADERISSSPSSFFLLILNNHRLLYVREQKGSPSLGEFQGTITKFLRHQHSHYIDALHQQSKTPGPTLTKKSLKEKIPQPKVDVRPIGSSKSVEDFIKQFQTLEVLKVDILPVNDDEIESRGLFPELHDAETQLGSKKTTVRFENKAGLSKGEVSKQVSQLAVVGNHEITFKGHDAAGGELNGNIEDFKIRIPIPWGQRPSIKSAAKKTIAKFRVLVDDGAAPAITTPPTLASKIASILRSLI